MALNSVVKLARRKDLLAVVSNSTKLIATKLAAENGSNTTFKNIRVFYSTFRNQYFDHTIAKELSGLRLYSVKTNQKEIDDYRTENNVTIIGEDIPNPYIDIENCEFPDYIKEFLKSQGFDKPTVIQSQAWPTAMSGQNFVGIAQTGTGKTLAYLLPAIIHIKEKKPKRGLGPVALVLAPTRELARQIEQVAKQFERKFGIRCACIYGGAGKGPQASLLQSGVDIVIATPGRLNDFLVSKVTTLSRCTYVVLDEADRMLDMGFEPQIRQAFEGVPLERQMLMFSATWPVEVQELAKDYLGEFVQVNVGSTELTANHNIQQRIHICDHHEKLTKFKTIMHEISEEGFGKVLVFANTKRFVDNLTRALSGNGWPAQGIHGDKTQYQRDAIIQKFKRFDKSILVATDVAARGLDVDGVTHVINYDFPNTTEDYIHRIGRTGRKGNTGVAHTLLTSEDGRQAKSLIAVLKEANQEVPQELENLTRSFATDKSRDRQFKRSNNFYNRNQNWNSDNRSSNSRNWKSNNSRNWDNRGGYSNNRRSRHWDDDY